MNSKKAKRIKLENIDDLVALDDFIIIEGHESEDVSRGGIIIPDKAKQISWQGTVVAVGPGKYSSEGKRLPIEIEIGDVVIYRNFLGWKLAEIDGKKYYAISADERLARIPRTKVQYES